MSCGMLRWFVVGIVPGVWYDRSVFIQFLSRRKRKAVLPTFGNLRPTTQHLMPKDQCLQAFYGYIHDEEIPCL